RTEIPLGVDGAKARRVRRDDLFAKLPRRRDALVEERAVDRAPVERPEPRQDLRARRIDTARERAAVGREDLAKSVGAVRVPPRGGSREEQGMPPPDRFVAAGLEAETDQSAPAVGIIPDKIHASHAVR